MDAQPGKRVTRSELHSVQIKLLDQFEADQIRTVTADLATHRYRGDSDLVHLPICVAYQAEGELKRATKRATCRLCGHKIMEGLQLSFFYDEEQNAWTAKEYHVHAEGCEVQPL